MTIADETDKVLHILFTLTYRFITDAPTPPPVTEERTEEGEENPEELVDRQGNYIINIIIIFSVI